MLDFTIFQMLEPISSCRGGILWFCHADAAHWLLCRGAQWMVQDDHENEALWTQPNSTAEQSVGTHLRTGFQPRPMPSIIIQMWLWTQSWHQNMFRHALEAQSCCCNLCTIILTIQEKEMELFCLHRNINKLWSESSKIPRFTN